MTKKRKGSALIDYCTVPPQSQTLPPVLEDDTVDLPSPKREVRFERETTYTENQALREAQRCLATIFCTYCEVCTLICPDLCITRNHETGHIQIDLDYCKGCGLCAHFCPKGALEMVLQ